MINLLHIYRNRKKVLGLNDRYLNYIREHNPKAAFKIADNKLLTKKVLNKAGIPTPKLIAVISDYEELEKFDWSSLPNSFVMKPVSGLEGGGIDIFYNKDKNGFWIRANKSRADINDMKQQAKDILDGKFSLNQLPDKVFFEERIRSHKVFKYYTYKGSPDVRVIVFNNIPIMSFLRLPTKQSEGKANLALGAIALGIDMAKGVTTSGIQGKSKEIEYIPGTKLYASGLKIPFWNKILGYSIQAQQATHLNFAAVDFLIDDEMGPVVVEMNARPGLSIQIANNDGLRWRLKKAMGLKVKTPERGIRLAKDLFGGEIEEEIEMISGKEVIGIYEKLTIYNSKNETIDCLAKIDTGADSSSIDKTLAVKLGFKDLIDEIENKNLPNDLDAVAGMKLAKEISQDLMPKYPYLIGTNFIKSSHGTSLRANVKITIKIKESLFETNATIFDRSALTYPVIIGRKSLQKFLVDPSKNKTLSH
jgi:alpha-L-glutamate ligase-like protein